MGSVVGYAGLGRQLGCKLEDSQEEESTMYRNRLTLIFFSKRLHMTYPVRP